MVNQLAVQQLLYLKEPKPPESNYWSYYQDHVRSGKIISNVTYPLWKWLWKQMK